MTITTAWHGCLDHNRNHCQDCHTCGCFDSDYYDTLHDLVPQDIDYDDPKEAW